MYTVEDEFDTFAESTSLFLQNFYTRLNYRNVMQICNINMRFPCIQFLTKFAKKNHTSLLFKTYIIVLC